MKNDRGIQLLLAWSGPASAVLSLLGMVVISGFVPPQDPSDSAQQIAGWYSDHDTRILIGMIVAMTGFTLFVPFGIGVALQTRGIENRPAMTYIQIACVAIAALEGVMAAFIWGAAAFRPGDMDPEITRTLNDLGWFAFLFDIPPFAIWIGAIAIAIFRDDSDPPVFPRWVGHFNIVAALLMTPGAFAMMFIRGPLAWDGLLAFWVRNGAYCLYLAVMFFVVRSAIDQQAGEEGMAT